MKQQFTAIDCFSGAGGLSLGLQQAGFQVLAAFDNNRIATTTYSANLGDHILLADARSLQGDDLLAISGLKRGEVDLVAGGPPCQGFSIQRRGDANDPRNELIFEFLRLVGEIAPKAFLMENVSALAGPKNRHLLELFCETARVQGYFVDWKVVNAAEYGVPQARKRLIVVGRKLKGTTADVFRSEKCDTVQTVRDAIGGLPAPGPYEVCGMHNHEPDNISDLNRLRISHVPPGGGREDLPSNLQLPCHAVSVEKAGHRGVYGRLWWDRPATTITTKCNSFTRGRFAHPDQHRNITMREAARLQGFPDDFVFSGGKVDVAHQVGNAVPPPLIKTVAENLKTELVHALSVKASLGLSVASTESTEAGISSEQHTLAVATQPSCKPGSLASGIA